MKKIFLVFIIMANLIFLLANDYKNTNYFEFETGSTKGNKFCYKTNSKQDLEGSGYNIHLTTYNDYYTDNFYMTSAIEFVAITDGYSRTYNTPVTEKHFVEVSEATINYKLTENDIATIGILSFKKGAFSEYTKSGLKQSEGLMTLYYLNMPGIFYTKYISDYKIQVGYAAHTKLKLVPTNRYEHSQEGSDILFLFVSKTYNKHTVKFNASHAKIIYDTVEGLSSVEHAELGTLDNIGVGYVYDNREYSGNLLYSIFALSQTKFDGTRLTSGYEISAPGVKISKEDDRLGYSLLLGAKKDIDVSNTELFIGTEFFYASKYWVSLVTDEISTIEYSWGDLGSSYKVYTGITITPKIKTSINYKYSIFDYQKLKGGNSVKEVNTHAHKIYFRLDYLF